MPWSISNKIGINFGIVLLVLILVGWISYRSTQDLIESGRWVSHTHQVLTGLNEVSAILTEAETGQRGYIITGEDRYLETYRGARQASDRKLAELRKLTSDNPIQQQRVGALESLVAAKFELLQETLELRRTKGIAAAAELILTGRGKNAMDAVRRSIDEIT